MAYYVPSAVMPPESVKFKKLTHIIYSFTKVIDNKMQFNNPVDHNNLIELLKYRDKNPDIKIMIACGGWDGSGGFSDMASTKKSRSIFIKSVLNFLNNYDLDGIDIDWEYPGLPGIGNPYKPEDKENFTFLMQELRNEMDKTGKDYVLTFAAAGWKKYFDHIELEKVMNYVDYINIMTYDFAGGNTPFTSHHTNLGIINYCDLEKTPAYEYFKYHIKDTPRSSEKTINFIINKGIAPGKIIIGAAFYGKTWKGVPPENKGLYQHNKGPGDKATIAYYLLSKNFENKNGYLKYRDSIAKAPFLYNRTDSIFITYDDTTSVKSKTLFARKNNLGGIMFWQLTLDRTNNGLLDAIYKQSIK
ncbi:MAG: glycoside hydrolase family 18 protein [Chlorobi bacterium]|nr:glycoside hydrolase family 18 protein [Chlorobiota bacterium]